MKLIAYSIVTLFAASAVAENLPRTPQEPNKKVIRRLMAEKSLPEKLSQNITLQLKGNLHGLAAIDFSLTGTGPEFATDTIISSDDEASPPPIVHFRATITQLGESRFSVSYNLSARIGIITSTTQRSNSALTKNYEFRDVSQKGSVIIDLGKPTVISTINGEAITLDISLAQ